jgi:hypothetical protein
MARKKDFIGVVPCFDDAEFVRIMRDNVSGRSPDGVGRAAPGPTRTTSQPFAETNQRKPYLPVEDTSTPPLADGVSFRQKI